MKKKHLIPRIMALHVDIQYFFLSWLIFPLSKGKGHYLEALGMLGSFPWTLFSIVDASPEPVLLLKAWCRIDINSLRGMRGRMGKQGSFKLRGSVEELSGNGCTMWACGTILQLGLYQLVMGFSLVEAGWPFGGRGLSSALLQCLEKGLFFLCLFVYWLPESSEPVIQLQLKLLQVMPIQSVLLPVVDLHPWALHCCQEGPSIWARCYRASLSAATSC